MPSIIKLFAFLSDHTSMSECLFSIQQQEKDGLYVNYPELILKLRRFENDVLKKLYNRTIKVLGIIEGNVSISTDYLDGDFEEEDYIYLDFNTGFLDTRNSGYSSRFKTILNIFIELTRREEQLTEVQKQYLDYALIPVLESFEELQDYLNKLGLSPCTTSIKKYFNNSSSVYLQAAGADGTNGIASGIHLRWSLTGELGDNHIPQGSLNNSNPGGFRRVDDFIKITRTPYVNAFRSKLDFEIAKPVVNNRIGKWTYTINETLNGKTFTNTVKLKFPELDKYYAQAQNLDPRNNSSAFLNSYSGLIEISLDKKIAFSVGFELKVAEVNEYTALKADIYSKLDSGTSIEETLNIRKTFKPTTTAPTSELIYGDNISRLVIQKYAGALLKSFLFETYDDFKATRNDADWTVIGNQFGLSLTEQVVFDRLEKNQVYNIDNLWPYFNDGAKVRVNNYKDKWNVNHDGVPDLNDNDPSNDDVTKLIKDPSIKEVVQTYLELSKVNSRAEKTVKVNESDTQEEGLVISYLDMLNLMALDFHVARMLGLGHIDTTIAAGNAEKYVYKITYTNKASASASEQTFEFLSLPTSKSDNRVPVKPAIRPVVYKLPTENELADTLFDSNGYSTNVHANTRIVNIGRKLFPDEASVRFTSDFKIEENFNFFEHNKPVLYGIEYRPEGQNYYSKPEITSTKTFKEEHLYYSYDNSTSGNGSLETIPVPDNVDSLFVHFEKNEGKHFYAIYGIDWFSRASVLSDEVATDITTFPLKNSLHSPSDVTAQYIQEEETLLFTTQKEQDWLKGRSNVFQGADVEFTRITFNYLDVIDITGVDETDSQQLSKVVKASKLKAWFRTEEPLEVKGLVTTISSIEGSESQLLVTVGGYELLDDTAVKPIIASADFPRFENSLLSVSNLQFKVLEVIAGTPFPSLRIEKVAETVTVDDTEQPEVYSTVINYKYPEVGDKFSLVENLNNQGNWEPIESDIDLVSFSSTNSLEIERDKDEEGNESKYLVGGITAPALIENLMSDDDQPEIIPGYYKITFGSNIVLANHPQNIPPFDPANPQVNNPATLQSPFIEWYKGLIRLPDVSNNKKTLDVARIHQLNPLVLFIYDAEPHEPLKKLKISSGPSDAIKVNFHPGYKAYLFSEPATAFNRGSLAPEADQNDKKILVALQAVSPGGFTSSISVPAVMMARRIEKPVKLDPPIPFNLRVRPDATGKAAFTFDTKIAAGRKSFGFAFYRTSYEDILYALYKPATVSSILSDPNNLQADTYFNNRLLALANLKFDQTYGNYTFPLPDREGLNSAQDYQAAIHSTLLPLTEQTPIFAYLKEGRQTDNKKPVIRDIDGNFLDPHRTGDPFPMVRTYSKAAEPGTTYVRFTDYTLSGTSRDLYFYATAEVTNQLSIGPLSLFTGPVEVLHTLAGPAPVIRTFSITETLANINTPLEVKFEISPFSDSEKISKVRIFRTTDTGKTVIPKLMDSFLDVELTAENPLSITDTFEDLDVVPLGEKCFYRLCGIRTIINERNELEEVLTRGSEVITVNLIDILNPEAPKLQYNEGTKKLTWQPTTRNGTYSVYKQTKRGNWERISNPITADTLMEYDLNQLGTLPSLDEDGDRIYHRFKVRVENSAGLLNLEDKELTV